MSDGTADPQATEPATEPTPEPAPLLVLRDGLTAVVDTEPALRQLCERLAAGTGPVAIDAERASGYRYSSRAYLVQLRRDGAGTFLVDPVPFGTLAQLQEALAGTEWILHAATQDLPCLAELGLFPDELFDTELAGRLLGYPRVGLATLVETLLGARLKKEHSAVDWSTRPLPKPWLEYAALDVEVLAELRERLAGELVEAGKDEWARQEFDQLRSFEPAVRVEAWRRTSGMHKVRGRRGLAAVRALWVARDTLAQQRDVTPSRLIPDSAIVAAAQAFGKDLSAAPPLDKRTLLATKGFHGRGAERYAARWVAALEEAAALPESELPTRSPRTDGPPVARAWAEKDPVAARRLALARDAVAAASDRLSVPAENLLTPDHLRRLLWTPPATREPDRLRVAVAEQLTGYGARPWQVEIIGPLLTEAILRADGDAGIDTEPDAGSAG